MAFTNGLTNFTNTCMWEQPPSQKSDPITPERQGSYVEAEVPDNKGVMTQLESIDLGARSNLREALNILRKTECKSAKGEIETLWNMQGLGRFNTNASFCK